MQQKYYVTGMDCAGCEISLEGELKAHPKIKKINASLKDRTAIIEFKSKELPSEEDLNSYLKNTGYRLHIDKTQAYTDKKKFNWPEFIKAFFITSIIVGIFLLIQATGIEALENHRSVNLVSVFLIGVVASISSCSAVVSGIVLTLSSFYSKTGMTKPVVIFHISRLVAFFLLGGVIGSFGSLLTVTPAASAIINIVVAVVMIVVAIDMLNLPINLSFLHLHPTKDVSKRIMNRFNFGAWGAPIILGAITFILPCGFTQSTQIVALSSGNFIDGAMIMLVFALGTLPVLALVSALSVKFGHSLRSGLFYKVAGLLIFIFSLYYFYLGLTNTPII